jgi:PPM family protein phosphatase
MESYADPLAANRMKARLGLEVASLSNVGLVRENNEDSYIYWEPEDDADFQRKGRLAVIADGMGGYEGGQEASRIAVETVRDLYRDSPEREPQAALADAFRAAHDRIVGYAVQNPELQGMGTTCTAAAIVGHELYFAHLGDSRLYLVRRGQISRLTRDHSYVGRLVESGIVRSEDAESHPQRHILTAAMGVGREAAADLAPSPVPLENGDTLILCTDGLWSLVTEVDIAEVVRERDPESACEALLQLALRRGAPDNITLQILRVSGA